MFNYIFKNLLFHPTTLLYRLLNKKGHPNFFEAAPNRKKNKNFKLHSQFLFQSIIFSLIQFPIYIQQILSP